MGGFFPSAVNGILTGDCQELSVVLPDECADMVLTDPPFGIGFKYNGYEDSPELYIDLLQWTIAEANRVIRPGGLCFVFVGQPRLMEVLPLFPTGSRIFVSCKNFVQVRPTAVQFAWDPVVFWAKEGLKLKEYKGRDWYVADTTPSSFTGANLAKFHPCPRPLDVITYMIDHFCPEQGLVVDFFMGSGTTAVAAKMTGRHWWGCEIDPEMARLARERVDGVEPLPLDVSTKQPHLDL